MDRVNVRSWVFRTFSEAHRSVGVFARRRAAVGLRRGLFDRRVHVRSGLAGAPVAAPRDFACGPRVGRNRGGETTTGSRQSRAAEAIAGRSAPIRRSGDVGRTLCRAALLWTGRARTAALL